MRTRSLIVLGILAHTTLAHGTKSDYERAFSLEMKYRQAIQNLTLTPTWISDAKFWFRHDGPRGEREFVLVDAVKAERTPAFDHAKLASELAKAANKSVDAKKLPFDTITFDNGNLRFAAFGMNWKWADNTLTKEAEATAAPTPPTADFARRTRRQPPSPIGTTSPNGKLVALVRNFNVYLRENKPNTTETPLSFDGTETDSYEQLYWSPDATKLLAMRRSSGGSRQLTLIESSPNDQLQPKQSQRLYLKPGDPIPQPKPRLFDIATKREVPVSDQLFANPWDISFEHWSRDSKRFLFVYNQRGHTVMRVVAIDAETGTTRAIINEECKTFFDYNSKLYLRYLDATNELIWMSERSGWNHLYLIDSHSGAVKNAITKGDWVVQAVERFDETARELTLRILGHDSKQDPYHVHYAKVKLDGSGFRVLTQGDAMHALQWSPRRDYFIDTQSRVDAPPTHELCKADGTRILTLANADDGELRKLGWRAPERFVAKGRDGTTDIHGIILRPSNFDPKKTYPVVEYIYAGPHDHHVPKRFMPWMRRQQLAELGFIVVQCDGMGTNWRSKAFHDVCWKNLGDGGFPDRIAWIRAAAKKFPEMDIRKGVGIFGGSAGGQNTLRGMLMHPEFYVVGVADCGCHDNRMDKVWWNELWMSWPIGPHYRDQSNVTQAHRLQGKLMLVVGEQDTNVDPSSTLQVANALIKADKDFELLVMPGVGHGAAETPYANRRRLDFFVRTMLHVEPRSKP
jgi:dipeptidyl-peptidase 4